MTTTITPADAPSCTPFPIYADGITLDLLVRDASQAPLVSARMVVSDGHHGNRADADRAGHVRLGSLPRGVYQVWVVADGFAPWSGSLLVTEGASSRVVELTTLDLTKPIDIGADVEATMLMNDCYLGRPRSRSLPP